jgi:hypothetical protein
MQLCSVCDEKQLVKRNLIEFFGFNWCDGDDLKTIDLGVEFQEL